MEDKLKKLEEDHIKLSREIEEIAAQRFRLEGAIMLLREMIEKQDETTGKTEPIVSK